MKISSIFCVPTGVDENIHSRISINQAYCNVNYDWWSGRLLPHLYHVNHDDWQHKNNEHAYQDRDHTGTFTTSATVTDVIAHAHTGESSVTVVAICCATLFTICAEFPASKRIFFQLGIIQLQTELLRSDCAGMSEGCL